jgi:hypothetical protein
VVCGKEKIGRREGERERERKKPGKKRTDSEYRKDN